MVHKKGVSQIMTDRLDITKQGALLTFYIKEKGFTRIELQRAIGLKSSTTMTYKVNDPGKFTVSEMQRVVKTLQLTQKQAIEVFFDDSFKKGRR